VTDRAQLAAIAPRFDWVVNTVSASGGGAEDYQRTYFEGTRNLIEWLADTGLKKFVYTSSTGVYGQDDGSLVDEHSAVEPEAGTGRVLAEAERLLLRAARERNFPAVVLRVAGIYGPGRGFYLRQMLSGQARIEGEGGRFVNMIHRDDLVGAIVAALERGQPGQVYNVCDDAPAPLAEVYDWLARELSLPPPPRVAGGTPGPGRRAATNKRVSNRRLREELGYQLKYPTYREGYRAELRARGAAPG
jgi:nucleoside-diphosphate-sugar epimerase